jgi:DNA invertase Pin-like site-specific DNA recombinase
MNNPQIRAQHLEKTAYVYLRQSSPTQVKHNVESGRRQRQMVDRVQQLGWPATSIQVLGGDTGRSGSTLHGREDYQVLLEGVLTGQAGLIAARELSRLVRDNQDWNHLVRLCRHQHVLLLDEHRLYDPTNAQDRVVLGVAGAFNEFEIAMIIDRMLESQRQKAARGELYEGRFAPGYICRAEPLCEKHPDERVQRAVQRVFDCFDRCVSVLQVHRVLVDDGFQLPVVPAGRDWRDIEWVTPTYDQLLDMLKHPIYAGIYVRGRKKTFTVLDDAGHVKKQRRRVPREQWQVFLEDHHEAYIAPVRWEKNVEKISANARGGGAMKPTPQESPALLAGVLRCRRCGNMLHTQYPDGQVHYRCRGGARQREMANKTCFSFPGARVEERVSELVREAVRPAAIAAAVQAAERLAADYQQRRQLIVDRVVACREAEARAAREYKATDATYGAVRQRLAAEWEQAIAAVQAEQARLAAFDRDVPQLPTRAQRQELDHLSEDLHRIWFHPQVSLVWKKQIVRTLIEEILVDVDEQRDEITLWIHWSGGHHSEIQEPRHRRKIRRKQADVQGIVEVLRKVLDDTSIAAVLNREKIRTYAIATWTARRVSDFRRRHGIAAFSESIKQRQGWLTGAEAANSLGISAMSVTRLIQTGILPAEQSLPGLPSVIQRDNLSLPHVQQAVQELKTSHNRPLTQDPNQLSLFPTTNS